MGGGKVHSEIVWDGEHVWEECSGEGEVGRGRRSVMVMWCV